MDLLLVKIVANKVDLFVDLHFIVKLLVPRHGKAAFYNHHKVDARPALNLNFVALLETLEFHLSDDCLSRERMQVAKRSAFVHDREAKVFVRSSYSLAGGILHRCHGQVFHFHGAAAIASLFQQFEELTLSSHDHIYNTHLLLYLGSHLLFEGVREHRGHFVDLLNFQADFTLREWAGIFAVARRLEFLEQFFSALTLLLEEVFCVGLPGLVFHLFRQLCH